MIILKPTPLQSENEDMEMETGPLSNIDRIRYYSGPSQRKTCEDHLL